MKKTKVLIFGASGMLGSMVADYLSRDESLAVNATMRSPGLIDKARRLADNIDWRIFAIEDENRTLRQFQEFAEPDWIINAVGIIKPYIHDNLPDEVERALVVNSCFPHWLARSFEKSRILQIATDCVYSGSKGLYLESDKHDALDVYGKTKSLGETRLANISHLRCSIIGPEPKSYVSLLEWFRRQKADAEVSGYKNHSWNGVTTLHFAKICRGIIKGDISLPAIQHIIPDGEIMKHELLCCFAQCYERGDIRITATDARQVIDRRLATENQNLNMKIWESAGYRDCPPSVCEMVEELAAFDYRFEGLGQ
ncbi:MAG: sugar nucleotide-binding protein [Sedimentisphaerales bacterium]|nr:sugar nucleotide-binding protein [Sedimentisphaerales bacterium]